MKYDNDGTICCTFFSNNDEIIFPASPDIDQLDSSWSSYFSDGKNVPIASPSRSKESDTAIGMYSPIAHVVKSIYKDSVVKSFRKEGYKLSCELLAAAKTAVALEFDEFAEFDAPKNIVDDLIDTKGPKIILDNNNENLVSTKLNVDSQIESENDISYEYEFLNKFLVFGLIVLIFFFLTLFVQTTFEIDQTYSTTMTQVIEVVEVIEHPQKILQNFENEQLFTSNIKFLPQFKNFIKEIFNLSKEDLENVLETLI